MLRLLGPGNTHPGRAKTVLLLFHQLQRESGLGKIKGDQFNVMGGIAKLKDETELST